jgi:hypothetical protein
MDLQRVRNVVGRMLRAHHPVIRCGRPHVLPPLADPETREVERTVIGSVRGMDSAGRLMPAVATGAAQATPAVAPGTVERGAVVRADDDAGMPADDSAKRPADAPSMAEARAAGLVLGPLLRHVGATDATLWVETDGPCEVTVDAAGITGRARTFQVCGHHYALVVVDGLAPGSTTPYTVSLDSATVWPVADSPYPSSVIRTIDPARPIRLLFGSCRSPVTVKVSDPTGSGEDVLGGYARRMRAEDPSQWPQALVMLGDQVYADEPSDQTREWLATRRDLSRPPGAQVVDFEEYAAIYREAWSDPDIRWLLSVMPSSMIFDDHDVIDDWNTSWGWRREMERTDWWGERVASALMSYWVYQHIGNLAPADLARDDLWRRVHTAHDAGDLLHEFAVAADREADGAKGALWSYRRDLGDVRLLVIDSRAGRILTRGTRKMVSDREFAWIRDAVSDLDYRHLVIGTSVPWLLPGALHDVEAADEALCRGTRGRFVARIAELARRAVDLEHWAAFNESFERLADLVAWVGRGGEAGTPPATICVLSGDVHHTYVSEATLGDDVVSRVHQLTCSPMHNGIPLPMRGVFRVAWSRFAVQATRLLVRWSRAHPATFDWSTIAGPWFGNHVASLVFDGPSLHFGLAKSERRGDVTIAIPVPEAELELAPLPEAIDGRGAIPTHGGIAA